MKLTQTLTLSALAAVLMISGVQSARAADISADAKTGMEATAPKAAHQKAAVDAKETVKTKTHKLHHKAKKAAATKVEAKTEAKTETKN